MILTADYDIHVSKNNFKKQERLTSRKDIEHVLSGGYNEFLYPFRIYWKFGDYSTSSLQIAFSVPKRSFKKAVDRNVLKRRMREAFRTNKHELLNICKDCSISVHVLIVYVASERLVYHHIENKIKEVIQFLAGSIHEKNL